MKDYTYEELIQMSDRLLDAIQKKLSHEMYGLDEEKQIKVSNIIALQELRKDRSKWMKMNIE